MRWLVEIMLFSGGGSGGEVKLGSDRLAGSINCSSKHCGVYKRVWLSWPTSVANWGQTNVFISFFLVEFFLVGELISSDDASLSSPGILELAAEMRLALSETYQTHASATEIMHLSTEALQRPRWQVTVTWRLAEALLFPHPNASAPRPSQSNTTLSSSISNDVNFHQYHRQTLVKPDTT